MNKQLVAMGLAVIGVLVIIAPSFDILPQNIGTFAGIACFMLSGLAWAFWPKKEKKDGNKK